MIRISHSSLGEIQIGTAGFPEPESSAWRRFFPKSSAVATVVTRSSHLEGTHLELSPWH